ncbi:MAG: alpha/beta hydrolase [Proteobacteria bacterium]|nr:alpha/beta hydrolase [Pseudomonadota bacterium]
METKDGYTLRTVRKGQGVPRRIYIEGDGRAFITSSQPSGDPTPPYPVGLLLMQADPEADALYIARPCQWLRGAECKAGYKVWTLERFTPAVVQAYVDVVAEESHGQPVELVGFSGGGFLALQVAARLDNVTAVRTVSGNVDPAYVNEIHKATPMEIAPWPESYGRLRGVPQVLYVGRQDKIVPPEVVQRWVEQQQPECVQVVTEDGGHEQGWVERWARLVTQPVVCGGR